MQGFHKNSHTIENDVFIPCVPNHELVTASSSKKIPIVSILGMEYLWNNHIILFPRFEFHLYGACSAFSFFLMREHFGSEKCCTCYKDHREKVKTARKTIIRTKPRNQIIRKC